MPIEQPFNSQYKHTSDNPMKCDENVQGCIVKSTINSKERLSGVLVFGCSSRREGIYTVIAKYSTDVGRVRMALQSALFRNKPKPSLFLQVKS